MNQKLSNWTSQPEFAGSDTTPRNDGAYHPDCGDEHDHKPTKAIIGVVLLMILSFLLYEFNGRAPNTHISTVPVAQHQSFAANR